MLKLTITTCPYTKKKLKAFHFLMNTNTGICYIVQSFFVKLSDIKTGSSSNKSYLPLPYLHLTILAADSNCRLDLF